MLVTLSEMKSYLGIGEGHSHDDFLTREITMISDTVELYCRRRFNQRTWEQTFYRRERSQRDYLELYHFPLVSIVSIVQDEVEMDLSELRIHKPTSRVFRKSGHGFYINDGTVVTFIAGYENIPTPLKQVVFSLVAERFNKKRAGVALDFGSDIQRISIPGTISIDFDYTLQNNEAGAMFGNILGNQRNNLDYWRSERTLAPDSGIKFIEEIIAEEPEP